MELEAIHPVIHEIAPFMWQIWVIRFSSPKIAPMTFQTKFNKNFRQNFPKRENSVSLAQSVRTLYFQSRFALL
jgi:hypothetical protein